MFIKKLQCEIKFKLRISSHIAFYEVLKYCACDKLDIKNRNISHIK